MTNVLFGGFAVWTVILGALLFLGIASIGLWVITLMTSHWVDSYNWYDEKKCLKGEIRHDKERSSDH